MPHQRETKVLFKDALKDWDEQVGSEGFTRLKGEFWNQPEGKLTIVESFMEGGSLSNLVEALGGMNE